MVNVPAPLSFHYTVMNNEQQIQCSIYYNRIYESLACVVLSARCMGAVCRAQNCFGKNVFKNSLRQIVS